MSWLARSIANTLLIDDDDDDDDAAAAADDKYEHHSESRNGAVLRHRDNAADEVGLDIEHRRDHSEEHNKNGDDHDDDGSDNPQGRGVKEDLSEFRETLTRQLWGVASFLAPPPPPPTPPPSRRVESDSLGSVLEEEEEEEFEEDDDENLGEYVEEEDRVENDAVGITEEALAFAQNIAHHPETWLDFPLSEEEDYEDAGMPFGQWRHYCDTICLFFSCLDFEISDAQYKHALAIGCLVPRLAALRIEFCPIHMNEGYFWMVYFVLLHSRLNKHDADLLSTPQLVQARAMWMQELQKQTKPETDLFESRTFYSQESTHSSREDFDPHLSEDSRSSYLYHTTDAAEPRPYNASNDFKTEKHPVESDRVQFSEKSIEDSSCKSDKELLAGTSNRVLLQDYDDDDGDDWVDDTAELEGYTATSIIVGNEEDVSFSDLEEDSDWTLPVKPK